MNPALALHAARLAQLEGALCALLRESRGGYEPNDEPDGLRVTFGADGTLDVEYLRGALAVAGESV